MKVKNYDYPDYKTARQWAKEGYLPKENVEGIELWANRNCQHSFIYYSVEDVEKADKARLDTFFAPERARKNELAKKRRAKRRAKIEAERRAEEQEKIEQIIKPYLEEIARLKAELAKVDTIVIDTETTGLDPFEDELLQVSIINGNGETLYDSYIKPQAESWESAERIHGISPAMVANAPSIMDEMPKINALISGAKYIIGYNTHFDLSFLLQNGLVLDTENVTIVDVMEIFAEIYGEWNDYYRNYKWQKLTTAAAYYHYDWTLHGQAHNSLADCYATLFVYNHILKEKTVGIKPAVKNRSRGR